MTKINNFLSVIIESKSILISIIILGLVNSAMNIGLLIFVNESLDNRYIIPYFEDIPWVAFAILLVGSLLINLIFQRKIIYFTNQLLFDFESSFLRKIKGSHLDDFEKLGKEKIYTHINDIRAIAQVPVLFVNTFNAFVIVVCCMFYFFMISSEGGLIIIAILAVLLILYLIRNRSIEKQLNQIRDLQNNYYQYLEDATKGFKEIKVDKTRQQSIYNDYLMDNRLKNKELSISTGKKFLTNELLGNYSWYLIIGIVLFLLPALLSLEKESLIGYIVIILYLISPVATLINLIPSINGIKIALSRLAKFDEELSLNKTKHNVSEKKLVTFDRLRLEEVVYSYFHDKAQREFILGPINLEIVKNEIVFITGGNGSGKSTLMNVILGLYKPKSGTLFINGIEVKNDFNLSSIASVIFATPHLFSENYNGFDFSLQNSKLEKLLSQMNLEKVIKKYDGHYRITKDLSKGQQKRVAMILALLEEKEVLFLDEWAAEQDKEFRVFFYNVLLSQLKSKGKTIIVISHDNQYFDVADRVIRLDLGKVKSDLYIKPKYIKQI